MICRRTLHGRSHRVMYLGKLVEMVRPTTSTSEHLIPTPRSLEGDPLPNPQVERSKDGGAVVASCRRRSIRHRVADFARGATEWKVSAVSRNRRSPPLEKVTTPHVTFQCGRQW